MRQFARSVLLCDDSAAFIVRALAAAGRLEAFLETDACAAAEVIVVGPAPCPIDPHQGLLTQAPVIEVGARGPAHASGRYFAERIKVPSRGGLRVIVDRDPVAVL